METIVDYLIYNAQVHPNDPAFSFVDFVADAVGKRRSVTWSGLERRVGELTDVLSPVGVAGQPVAVVAPQGIDYVVAFLGAMRAGAVAVPLFPPRAPGRDERLASALADSAPACVLTTTDVWTAVSDFCVAHGIVGHGRIIAVDDLHTADVPAELPGPDQQALPRSTDCAYLQYTSGSTRAPAGVEITHANVAANVEQATKAFDIHRNESHIVSWLPLFHDMGLVLAVAIPVVGAVHSVIMDPLAFVQQPYRWLRLLSDHNGAVTAAPNFAYDYCVRRVPEPLRSDLSLDAVSVLINGSEPIRPGTLARFQQAFGPCGVSPAAMRPSYGLAEATVFVSTSPSGDRPRITSFDRVAVRQGFLRPAATTPAEGVTELVACGMPVGQEVTIVNARTCRPLPDGEVGEIWVRGPNVARGYWRNPMRSAESFDAAMANEPQDDDEVGRWLRTGDLGAVDKGLLYVTGRIKDLIIIDGTNHYPQDIESTVQDSHGLIRYDHVAAFSLADEEGERLVVVAEHERHLTDPGPAREAAGRSVREAVLREHGVVVHDFVLAPPGTVPRTTSGKVARSATRRRYLAGNWAGRMRADMAGAGEAE
jgi:acyl-CoA synthetase (AMP-forming)/AMP-acid ligase II